MRATIEDFIAPPVVRKENPYDATVAALAEFEPGTKVAAITESPEKIGGEIRRFREAVAHVHWAAREQSRSENEDGTVTARFTVKPRKQKTESADDAPVEDSAE